jgi:hypothetical protein
MTKLSERKEYEIRTKKKKIIEAIRNAIDSIQSKMDRGEILRDEDLRFLKTVFKEWPALEESIVEEKKPDLPEGTLKIFVERFWKLSKIAPLEEVLKDGGYFRCDVCNEIHPTGRSCMYDEYREKHEPKELDMNVEVKEYEGDP